MTTLAERLGHAPDAKLLIVNCDDLGSTRAANVAVYEALRDGLATSATLMVPCPWSRDAASGYRGEDVGVHLTLNSEWENYRWGPITHSPSLLDGDGGFPRTVEDVWDHADLEEVRRHVAQAPDPGRVSLKEGDAFLALAPSDVVLRAGQLAADAVRAKGYRLTTTRSTGSMPKSAACRDRRRSWSSLRCRRIALA